MKKGSHPYKKLSAAFIRSVTDAGKYHDGNGLRLVVVKNGYKQWKQRITVKGTGKRIELGGFGAVGSRPLTEVRQMALDNLNLARSGINPKDERGKPIIVVPTFEELAYEIWNELKPNWKNRKHTYQWINTLKTYAFPVFGDKPVDQITSEDCLKVISPIWLDKHETANRVRMRINNVMERAQFVKYRPDNPLLGIKTTLPKIKRKKEHWEALPYKKIQGFISDLRTCDKNPSYKLAAEFLIHTQCRSANVREAEWSEINLERKEWTISGEKMKANRDFTIPLSKRAMEILKEARAIHPESLLIFPQMHQWREKMGDSALRDTLQFRGDTGHNGKLITAHGMRTTCREFLDIKTNFPFKLKEIILDHKEPDDTVKAYSRSKLLAQRRNAMEIWAAYMDDQLDGVEPYLAQYLVMEAGEANVIPFKQSSM